MPTSFREHRFRLAEQEFNNYKDGIDPQNLQKIFDAIDVEIEKSSSENLRIYFDSTYGPCMKLAKFIFLPEIRKIVMDQYTSLGWDCRWKMMSGTYVFYLNNPDDVGIRSKFPRWMQGI